MIFSAVKVKRPAQRNAVRSALRDHAGLRRGRVPVNSGVALRPPHTGQRAFTLMELILVMALIVIMAAVVAPRMADFFRGRTLDNEARRFMTLTRFAQNRAVSEGVPMLVWIDEDKRLYGLEAEPGYLEPDPGALEYRLASELEIEVGDSLTPYGVANAQQIVRNLPVNVRFIRFTPEGFISDASPEYVLIRRNAEDAVAIGPARNWQHYEVYTNDIATVSR